MSLVGNRYIQANDPGAVGVGYQWLDTDTSLLYERNGSNTAWVQVYNTNQSNGGLLPQTGGSVTGAITGTTGWAPSDNPNFATAAKIAGQNIATVNYVNQQVSSFNDLISAKISQAIASSSTSISVNSSIAKIGQSTLGSGYYEPTAKVNQTATIPPNFPPIPLPNYPSSGGPAQESECVWIGSPAAMYKGTGPTSGLFTADANNEGSDFYIVQTFEQVSSRVFKHYWASYETNGGTQSLRSGYLAAGMYWMIFAVKSSQ